MKGIFCLILIFILFIGGGNIFALDLGYLRIHREEIIPGTSFELLFPGLEDKKIFLAGEAHGVAVNADLGFDLLLFLHENAGVRYLLWEGGFALGSLLNRYVQGDSEKLLDLVFSQLEGTALWSREEYAFFQRLADFNSRLKEEERVEIIGLDLDLPLTGPVIFLDYLLGEKEAEILEPLRELAKSFRQLKGADQLYSSRVRLEALRLEIYLGQLLKKERDYLEKLLGDNWFDFDYTLRRLSKTNKIWGEGPQVREDYSFANLVELSENLDRGGFFGRWGANHVLQRTQGQVNWLGSLFNGSESPWQEQVLSVYFVYDHCQRMDQKTYREVDYSSGEIRELEVLRRAAEGEITLFWLDSPGSPFREDVFFLTRHSRGVTTDYFQYIILVRNQPAAKPLTENWK